MKIYLKISVVVTILAVVSMPVIGQIKVNSSGNVRIGTSNPTQEIQAGQLAASVYTYLLIGDGKASEAKQMILTK
jgi:hypothetical protein